MKKIIALILILMCIYSYAMGEAPATPTDLQECEVEIILQPTVTIWSDRQPIMQEGEVVTLYSKVENTEGWIIKYQWEWGMDGIFTTIPEATEPTYSFIATKESLALDYRLIIYFKRDCNN